MAPDVCDKYRAVSPLHSAPELSNSILLNASAPRPSILKSLVTRPRAELDGNPHRNLAPGLYMGRHPHTQEAIALDQANHSIISLDPSRATL